MAVERSDQYALLRLVGDLTTRSAARLRRTVRQALSDHGSVVADVSALRIRDRSAVRVFVDAQLSAGGWPWARLAIGGADREFAAAAESARLDDEIPVRRRPADAVLDLTRRPRTVRQHRRFGAAAITPRHARVFIGEVADAWSLDADTSEIVQLIASELVSNSVEHAHTGADVVLELTGAALRIEVRDGSTQAPVHRVPDAADPRGRGIALVDRLSDQWGVRRHRGGKTVWACLTVPVPAVPTAH